MNPTAQQQAVIDAQDGDLIVEACPGSGKTATLVERCRALPDDETKLVLAFNKRAAEEFKERLGCVSGSDVRTFHSFCFREVMANPQVYGYRSRPRVADKPLLRLMLEANAGEFQYRNPRTWGEAGWDEDFAKEAEHSLYDGDLLRDMDELGAVERQTARALLRYRRWLLDNGLITFDAMVRVVAENTKHLRPPAQHVMVDEYQDVDRFQYEIALALSRLQGVRSFAVVGDPNQRIYEWRGALADAFGSLRATLNGSSRTLPMTVNFRSHDEILEHAETICPVGMTGVRGPRENAVAYVQRITDEPHREGATAALLEGLSPREYTDVAILCRYNRDALKWQLDLARAGYPVYMLGAGDFWSARHVQMALKARDLGASADALFGSEDWVKFAASRRFRDNPEKLEECKDDARWVIKLSASELATLRENVQHEGGIRISSIHRSKGLEWARVLVWNVTQKLRDERFVFYVAATRARDQLILA